MTRIVMISDTHTLLNHMKIPDGDILIHAGDGTFQGFRNELENFAKAMAKLPHKHKIFVPGNHETTLDPLHPNYNLNARKWMKPRTIHTLINRGIEVEGFKVYGTPVQPWFHDWGFNIIEETDRAKEYARIPDSTQILITHCPPYGIQDTESGVWGPWTGEPRKGCMALRARVDQLKELKLHVFGHIHEGYGMREVDGTIFVNAAQLCNQYQIKNIPIVVDL